MGRDEKHSIASLLASRNASLKGESGNTIRATQRAQLTHLIREDYPAFEPVRDMLLKRNGKIDISQGFGEHGQLIIERLINHGMVEKADETHIDSHITSHPEAKRYLGGGWLEELAWLAAMEAGADEAVFSQNLQWSAKGYHGQNEVDLILRKGDRLGFTSCKAVNSEFNPDSKKHRSRLMDALHEADNLVDHFGGDGDRVAVLVTADLIDEVRNKPRYIALMGKAAVLDVRIIPLEELGWDALVKALGELIDDDPETPPRLY